MAQRKFRKAWWVDFRHNGERYRKKSPENSKSGARRYELTLRRQLARGVPIGDQKDHTQSFRQFAETWFNTHVVVNNKPSMVKKTRGILDRQLIPTFGNYAVNSITTFQVERFKSIRATDGVANKTINSELGVLGKCLRDAKQWLDIERIPEIQMLKLPPTKFDFLSEDECVQLLSELYGVWFDITYLAIKTGLRRGELEALRWDDVQLDRGLITVRHSRCSITNELLPPKGNQVRSVPLSTDVLAVLEERRNKTSFVFGIDGAMFNGERLNRNLAKACKRAGIRTVTCHVLRHTFASQLAMQGVPIIMIQKLLGHTDIKVTMRYAHLSQDSLHEVTSVLNGTFSPPTRDAA